MNRMAQGLSTANGAFFCLLLLALYLPTAGLLRLRGLDLVEEGEEETNMGKGVRPAGKRSQQAREEGLVFSPFQELTNLLVAFAPLLAGGPLAAGLDLLRL